MVRFVLAVASALALVMFVGASVPSLAREAALPEDAGDSPFRYWPLADGNPEAVRNHPDVIKAYLGET